MVTPLPPMFERIANGDRLKIGNRAFEVITAEGHAPEQAMLYCAQDKLLIAGDQVMEKDIAQRKRSGGRSDGDPLGLYLRSLAELKARAPNDALVLAATTGPSMASTSVSTNWPPITRCAAPRSTRRRARPRRRRNCCPSCSTSRSTRMR